MIQDMMYDIHRNIIYNDLWVSVFTNQIQYVKINKKIVGALMENSN